MALLTAAAVLTFPGGGGVGASAGDAPARPARPAVTAVSHDSVTLSWADPADDSVTGYQILRREPAIHGKRYFEVLVADTQSAATSYTDDTVDASKHYRYRVRAINAAGTSPRSRSTRVDTPAAPEAVAPAALGTEKQTPEDREHAVDPADLGTRSHQTGQSPWSGHTIVEFGSGSGTERVQFNNTDAGQQVWFRFVAGVDDVVEFRIPGSPFASSRLQAMDMRIWHTGGSVREQNGREIVNDKILGNFLYFIPENGGTYYLQVDYPGRYTDPDPTHFKVVLSRPTDNGDWNQGYNHGDCPSGYFTHKNCRITGGLNAVDGHFLNTQDHSYRSESGVKDVDVWTAWLRPGQDYEICVQTYAAGGFVLIRSFAGTLYAEGAGATTVCSTTGEFRFGTKFYFRVYNTTGGERQYTVFLNRI